MHGEPRTLLMHDDDTTKNSTSESAIASQCLGYDVQDRSPEGTVTMFGVPGGRKSNKTGHIFMGAAAGLLKI